MNEGQEKLIWLQREVSRHVTKIKTYFLNPVRVAIVVRNPKHPERCAIIGDASGEDIEFVLKQLNKSSKEMPGNVN